MSLRERFEDIQNYINRGKFDDAIAELKNITSEYGKEEMTDDFIDTESMDDFVKARFESGGWQSVICCLAKIDYLNWEYYEIDGYANLKEVTASSLECTLSDLKRELSDELEEDEEEDI